MEKQNSWLKLDTKKVMDFCDGYMKYLDSSKTERQCIKETVKLASDAGFKPFEVGKKLNSGDKIYFINRNKNILLAVIGSDDIESGASFVAAHIDSPRLDLKPTPLYEDANTVLFKTHYYGGIKKYQWMAIPLSVIGVAVKSDGTVIDINIGEDENDPVFTVTDLLDNRLHYIPENVTVAVWKDPKSRLVLEKCDFKVTIPMYGNVNSFNVATAAAVLLAEASRQHHKK